MLAKSAHTRALFMGALLLATSGCGEVRPEQPVAIDGVIDFANWDFDKYGVVELKGEWRFVWEEFVEPMPSEAFREKYQGTIQVSQLWPTQPHPHESGQLLPGQGHATYALEVRLPTSLTTQPLGIALHSVTSAAEWWVYPEAGGQVLGHMAQGAPGTTLANETPVWMPTSESIAPGHGERLILLAHVSNFRHARGGVGYVPRLGVRKLISEAVNSEFYFNASIVGLLAIIALYHLVLFWQRREDLPSLFFALFCSAMALRQFITGDIAPLLNEELSSQAFGALIALEYITIPLMGMCGGLFVHALVPGRHFELFVKGFCVGGGALLILMTLSTSSLFSSGNVYLYQVHILAATLIGFGYIIHAAMKGHVVARWLALAFVLIVFGNINDILHTRSLIQTMYVAPYCFIGFVLMQSGILSGKAAYAFRRAKHLGENLQKEVESQTSDLQQKSEQAEASRREADDLRAKAEEHSLELEVLDQQKTHFFQNISHELRTPLTLILGPLEEASAERPADQRVEVALRNSRRLLRLVNQLLDFQKLSAGKEDFSLEPVNVVKFSRICGDYFSSSCSIKKISFQTTLNGEPLTEDVNTALYVQGNLDALEKVVFNFLSNALKYTPPEGSITLAIREADGRIRIRVADTGPGIAKEEQQKLFQVFSQVDSSTTRDFEGTGLGLALAKELTEKMAGCVGLESDLGEGSSFWAEFPALASLEPVTDILLVDDDTGLLAMLAMGFERFATVQTAESTDEAIALLETREFRIVISDARMPGRDGTELLSHVNQRYPDTVRILYTGEANDELLQRAVNDGQVHRIWYKPVNLDVAEGEIKEFIAKSKVSSTDSSRDDFAVKDWLLDEVSVDVSADVDADAAAHPRGGGQTVLVVDDLPDMRQLISSTLSQHGYQVVVAKDGKHGLELAKSTLPSLIVTDWMMPQMSGPELIEAIRADDVLAGIPTVLLTAKSDEESRLAGKEIGADSFLGKPFNAQELVTTVRNLIQLKSNEEKLRVAHADLKETSQRELRYAKNLLTQSEKLAQLGEMVASIGHEIANPIMLISLSAESGTESIERLEKTLVPLFTDDPDAEAFGKTVADMIGDIRRGNEAATTGVKRLKDLSMALRTQSRLEHEVTPGVQLNEVVKESMVLVGGRTKVHQVDDELGELPPITCFRSKVGQVVTNLLSNAADSLSEKAAGSKEKRGQRFRGQISVISEAKERDGMPGVLVAVSDNGDGVPESIREKIFEQFFTTKPAGVGTGLGLAMCVDIVKEHGGMLSVSDDETLGGARFELWLPVEHEARAS